MIMHRLANTKHTSFFFYGGTLEFTAYIMLGAG
jgi:hypothetical protein